MDEYEWAMLLVVGLATILAIFVAIQISQDEAITSLGTEVQTTAEYKDTFNDSFSGRVICRTGRTATVRNNEGVERTFAKKWLEGVT